MSEYVAGRAKPGDAMPITGPFGRFYLRKAERPILMVAGGTGLAPMLSMFDYLKANRATSQPIRLLYGANRPEELFELDRLKTLAAEGLNLATELCVVGGDSSWRGPTGHITSLLRPDLVNGGDVDAYLCGPPPMIDAGTAWLKSAGVDDRRIHTEKFLPS
jgi:NAD(P)H-flavin reductase